jgi:Flp pilus assembly pilin Flp
MTMSISVCPVSFDEARATPAQEKERKKIRRGVTAMEYLVCISFILVVVIFTVQSLGIKTGALFGKSSNATNAISNSSGSNSNGSGNSNGNGNSNGSGNSNGNGNSNGSGNSNGNGNGNGNGKGKGP